MAINPGSAINDPVGNVPTLMLANGSRQRMVLSATADNRSGSDHTITVAFSPTPADVNTAMNRHVWAREVNVPARTVISLPTCEGKWVLANGEVWAVSSSNNFLELNMNFAQYEV